MTCVLQPHHAPDPVQRDLSDVLWRERTGDVSHVPDGARGGTSDKKLGGQKIADAPILFQFAFLTYWGHMLFLPPPPS